MEYIRIALDWILIILSTYWFVRSTNKMILRPSASSAHVITVIVWIFCCAPIILDYFIGLPKYETVYWYRVFIEPMANDEVSCLYDLLILATMFALYFYSVSADRRLYAGNSLFWATPLGAIKPLIGLAIVAPVLYILFTGLLPYYFTYGDSASRGLPTGTSSVVTALLLISVVAFCTWFFSKESFSRKDAITILLYSFVAAWVSGKRFMIAVILFSYFYFYLNRNLKESSRRKLKQVVPIVLIVFLAFCAFYLTSIRPLSDTGASSVYEMLRVDFGRDDVTKYVIYQELFLGNHILDYPGQSFLSTFFVWVPRLLWPTKPFQHYQYLTSSILGLPIESIPAGTTPSWWEMCIANFSIVGFIVAVLGIVVLVYLADKTKTVTTRATMILLIVALLTQSIDAYISLVLLLIVQIAYGVFIKRKEKISKLPDVVSDDKADNEPSGRKGPLHGRHASSETR